MTPKKAMSSQQTKRVMLKRLRRSPRRESASESDDERVKIRQKERNLPKLKRLRKKFLTRSVKRTERSRKFLPRKRKLWEVGSKLQTTK